MEFQIAAFSRTGGRERNEDACGYVERNGVVCCVLADGAGGHGGGDVAARTCVQCVLDAFARGTEVSAEATSALLHKANDTILGHQRKSLQLEDMRSTAVVLLIDSRRTTAAWGHVGDSRLYLFRQGALHLRTRDHSVVQTMVESGILREEEAAGHRESNVLFTSLGLDEAFQPEILATPSLVFGGDAFLLCSDGLWGCIPERAITTHLARSRTPTEWLDAIEQDVARQEHAGSDNYSAIAIWCGDPADSMRTQPRLVPR